MTERSPKDGGELTKTSRAVDDTTIDVAPLDPDCTAGHDTDSVKVSLASPPAA